MTTIFFLKARDRRDTGTADMFGTHVETHTRKDGVVQTYHVAAPAPKSAKPLTALQAHELKLENTMLRYMGKPELTDEEFLEQQGAIKLRVKAAKLRADAKRIAASAESDLGGVVAGQPVMSTRDRNKREAAGDKMRRAGDALKEVDEIEAKLAKLGSMAKALIVLKARP